MIEAAALGSERQPATAVGSERKVAVVAASQRSQAKAAIPMGLTRTEREQFDAMREKLGTIPRGGIVDRTRHRLWSVNTTAETTRPPFAIGTSFVEVGQQRLPAGIWRDGGVLAIKATVEFVLPASPSSNFILIFELQSALDYQANSWVSSSVRGKIPTALGSWTTAETVTLPRIDNGAGLTNKLFLDWRFTQGRMSGATFSQDSHARAEWHNPASGALTAPMTRESFSGNTAVGGNTPIDPTVSRLLRMRVKVSSALAAGTVSLLSTHAWIDLPRTRSPIP